MIFYIITLTICLWIFVCYFRSSRPKVPSGMKALPVEKGWPIIGILNSVKGPLCNYLTKLGWKHGPIFMIKYGMRDVLVLNNSECMKAALVDNAEAFSGRWHLQRYITSNQGCGVLNTEGKPWADQRSYLLKTLKDFGFGKSISVEMVQDECIFLLKDLAKLNAKTIDFFDLISLYTANIISKFIMNKRFSHEDREMKIIEKTMRVFADKNDVFANFALIFPFLDRNEWLMKLIAWMTSRKSVFSESHKIFEDEVRERLKTFDFNSEGEDLLERFLAKQHHMKGKDGKVGTFTDVQLIISAFELFIAGYDTTSSTLTWGFMFMAMNQDVQQKVYEEICDQIGTERMPTMSDKASLVYTQAVMDEIFRLGTVAPLAIIHRTLKSTCVNGYFIPKDTLVMPNIFASHLDHTVWEKFSDFYPSHFLSTDEKGNLKYKPRVELVTFSMGKRQCLGESLARTEYFIFFTSIMQKFQVSLSEESAQIAGKTPFDIFHCGDGAVRKSKYKDFIFKIRN